MEVNGQPHTMATLSPEPTHWMGPRVSLNMVQKRKIPPLPGINSGHPGHRQSQYLLSYTGSFME